MKLETFLKSRSIDRAAREPVYEQLAAILREAIEQGHLPTGARLPTTRELCEIFDLNHLTVRQAIRHLESSGSIIVKPARGAFVPEASERVRKVLLMLPTLGDDHCAGISRGVRSILDQEGFDIYIQDYNTNPEIEKSCLQKLSAEGYDGAILYPSLAEENTQLILRLLVQGFPVVMLDREFSGVPGWYVLSDNFMGGYLAGKHLIEKGCRQPACVMNRLPNVQDRLRGFQTALLEAGIALSTDRIKFIESEGDPLARCTEMLLKKERHIDGIFYYNDFQALYGYKKIKEAGRVIPDEIKVIGFDDMSAARFADPELTTIHQYPEQIGVEAAQMFLRQFALPPEKRFQKQEVIVPVQLVCRESAG